ncbi:MAG TPA: hypothetical protein PK413_12785, partial [Thermoanaerobaculia bacterium]|nr:hypothetical protein [Thermoanaerobaculia bacterium]
MIRKRIWTVGLLGLAWVPQLYAGSAVTLSTNEVAITGLAPGGTGVLIAVARELSEGIATVVVRDGLLPDTDGDG